jgi:hypothetical protein
MAMWRSTDRILTTHGGNLPRPADLDNLIADWRDHQPEIEERLPGAIKEVVDKQLECGVTILNEGEYVKAASGADYVGYIHSRVAGWETRPVDPAVPPKRGGVAERDRLQFPGFYESGLWLQGSGGPVRPGFFTPGAPQPPTRERVCTSPVTYIGHDAIGRDVAELVAAVEGRDAQGFIAALGPLSLGAGARNEYYPDEESYMMAVAEVMREEYKAVTDAGLVLQAARRQDPRARRGQSCDGPHRAPRARRGPPDELRQRRGPGERAGGDRLRHRVACRPSRDRLGEASRHGPGSSACQQAAVEVTRDVRAFDLDRRVRVR